jgi:hypothetical protein
MPASTTEWDKLDSEHRKELDEQYLEELSSWAEPGLDDEAVQEYLRYRHQRPDANITTFEEGQIRKLLHRHAHPEAVPDPVELEEHTDPIERFGARRLHLTNAKTYLAVMLVGTLLLLWAVVIYLFVWS